MKFNGNFSYTRGIPYEKQIQVAVLRDICVSRECSVQKVVIKLVN